MRVHVFAGPSLVRGCVLGAGHAFPRTLKMNISGTFHFRNKEANCPGTDLGVRPGTVLVHIFIIWSEM